MDLFLSTYSGLFLSAFISFFVVVDPFGTSAVFVSLTKNMAAAEKRRIAVKAMLIAISLIVVFSLLGQWVLNHMNVSLDAFRIAGGLLLFVTAFRMIMGFHDQDQLESEKTVYKDKSAIAVFPLSIPLLAGPGVLTAALMFVTTAETVAGYSIVLGAAVLMQFIALGSLLSAAYLAKFFGETGNSIIARVMGILLAGMAVQFIADGYKSLMLSL